MVELPSQYQQFIHLSRYARWNYDENRREHWNETVARYFDFFTRHMKENCAYNFYVKNDADVVAELKAQMEELKEERAAMKVHTPDNKATKLDWKEVAIQNALKFKK